VSALDRDPGDAVTREAGPRGSAYAVEHVTCLGCGCACDDIRVVVRDGRIVRAEQACPLGATWFGDGVVPGRASVGGHASALEPALDRAAALLAGAARPLVYVAPALSCEAQRAAVAVADLLAARLDSVTSATVGVATLAAQRRGRAGATLGEVRNRADLVVFWAVDPDVRYPRFTERYAPLPAGLAVPGGRGSRTVVAVDVGAECGYAAADARLAVAAEDEGGAIAAARAALLDGTRAAALLPADAPWLAPAQELARRIAAAKYVAIVYDGEAPDAGSRAEGLIALAQAANGPTRCALVALRAGGNRSGAEAVFTWQTGFPMAVDFAQGAPRYEAGREHAVAALATHDVVLLVGDSAGVPAAVADALAHVPCVAVGPFASEIAPTAEVAVDVGLPGVHEGGTALRLDDVPLPLRAVLPGAAPDAVAVLAALTARLRAQRQGRAAAGGAPNAPADGRGG